MVRDLFTPHATILHQRLCDDDNMRCYDHLTPEDVCYFTVFRRSIALRYCTPLTTSKISAMVDEKGAHVRMQARPRTSLDIQNIFEVCWRATVVVSLLGEKTSQSVSQSSIPPSFGYR